MSMIDIHSHFFPPIPQRVAREFDAVAGVWLKQSDDGDMIMQGEQPFRPVTPLVWNPAARLADLDRQNIDIQMSCATPVLFGYHYPAKQAWAWAQRMNDMALEFQAYAPERLKVLCQVPLQDIELSCREVDRAVGAGHIGVQIGNHVGDKNLDDPGILEFLSHCGESNIPVFVHPWDMLGKKRMPKYMLQWLVGMPAETQLGVLSLILSGAFERLPKSLKICFAHGGGNIAFQLGRIDNAWRYRDIVREDCPQLPSSYTNRFYVDSAVFSPAALQLLLEVMGNERIMLGTDYPFPLGEQRLGELVAGSVGCEDARQRLCSENAREFFAL